MPEDKDMFTKEVEAGLLQGTTTSVLDFANWGIRPERSLPSVSRGPFFSLLGSIYGGCARGLAVS